MYVEVCVKPRFYTSLFYFSFMCVCLCFFNILQYKHQQWLLPTHCPIQWVLGFRYISWG
jgi:hypothetical protein